MFHSFSTCKKFTEQFASISISWPSLASATFQVKVLVKGRSKKHERIIFHIDV